MMGKGPITTIPGSCLSYIAVGPGDIMRKFCPYMFTGQQMQHPADYISMGLHELKHSSFGFASGYVFGGR
jgi:hypothetical protein